MKFTRLTFDLTVLLENELPELMDGIETLGCHVETSRSGDVAHAYFRDDSNDQVELLLRRLETRGVKSAQVDGVEAQDWMHAFRRDVRPFEVGTLWWVDPHPETPTAPPAGRIRLAIEPRMAFGSGTHESTQIVLELMEGLFLDGKTVLDVGTGSGILAIAALQLGAARAVAFDTDADSIWVARETAQLQRLSREIEFFVGPISAVGAGRFDVIACNMVPANFFPLLPDIHRCVAETGRVVVSGVLSEQRSWVVAELAVHGLGIIAERHKGEWMALVVSRDEDLSNECAKVSKERS